MEISLLNSKIYLFILFLIGCGRTNNIKKIVMPTETSVNVNITQIENRYKDYDIYNQKGITPITDINFYPCFIEKKNNGKVNLNFFNKEKLNVFEYNFFLENDILQVKSKCKLNSYVYKIPMDGWGKENKVYIKDKEMVRLVYSKQKDKNKFNKTILKVIIENDSLIKEYSYFFKPINATFDPKNINDFFRKYPPKIIKHIKNIINDSLHITSETYNMDNEIIYKENQSFKINNKFISNSDFFNFNNDPFYLFSKFQIYGYPENF